MSHPESGGTPSPTNGVTGAGPLAPSHEPMRLVHHHPGYMRIHAGAFTGAADDNSVVRAAEAAALEVAGFRTWTHNPRTGSIVVEYDPGVLEADDLLKHIAKGAGLSGVENSTSRKRNREGLVSVILDSVQEVNQVVTELTGDRADLRELAPVALAATSVVSFVLNEDRGRLPEWSGALYHSYRVFMQWHRKEIRTREAAARKEDESRSSVIKSGSV